jgi:RNA polymerase sigma factor (sigma-70 family)
MNEKFAEDYIFIQEVIHYIESGTEIQHNEYKEKLLSRYGSYIIKIIISRTEGKFELKDEIFNVFACKFYKLSYLKNYRGEARFQTYIYPEILASIRKVIKKTKPELISSSDPQINEKRDFDGNEPTNIETTLQHNQEHLLFTEELRFKLDHATSVSILNLSKTHPQDARILVQRNQGMSWSEIAIYMNVDADSVRRRYSRENGILHKYSKLLLKALLDAYKIDFSIISENIDDILGDRMI